MPAWDATRPASGSPGSRRSRVGHTAAAWVSEPRSRRRARVLSPPLYPEAQEQPRWGFRRHREGESPRSNEGRHRGRAAESCGRDRPPVGDVTKDRARAGFPVAPQAANASPAWAFYHLTEKGRGSKTDTRDADTGTRPQPVRAPWPLRRVAGQRWRRLTDK